MKQPMLPKIFLILGILASPITSAVKLGDYRPYHYEVLFTNPICKEYFYKTPLQSQSGQKVFSKTKNAYCKGGDSYRSTRRPESPHQRLVDWINDPSSQEIFLTYLSFSKQSIAKALCNAIEKRNVKVTLVIDANNEKDFHRMAKATYVSKCRPQNLAPNQSANIPTILTRGHSGRGKK